MLYVDAIRVLEKVARARFDLASMPKKRGNRRSNSDRGRHGNGSGLPEVCASCRAVVAGDQIQRGGTVTRRDKAILALVCAAEIINCAKAGALKSRIADLETQRDIYASRAQHWIDRAVEDEEVIDSMQLRLDALADGKVELEDAGVFFCTAYCTEQYPHICGEGHGITASGQPIQAGVTVAADQTIFPYGTVLYIEGVGIRIVQDKGAGVQGTHIDVAVDTHENALAWSGYGEHQVWILKGE